MTEAVVKSPVKIETLNFFVRFEQSAITWYLSKGIYSQINATRGTKIKNIFYFSDK